MANPDFFGEPRTPRLQSLLGEFFRGEIRIPRFQRPFVWSDEQRLLLLESVYRGYPIGSVLVWRTQRHTLRTFDALGPVQIPPEPDPGVVVVRQYLIDGHQRMTTLFAALGPGLASSEEEKVTLKQQTSADDDAEARWPIYFDLEETKDNPFKLASRRDKPKPTWLSLDCIYDSYALSERKDELRKSGADRTLLNRVQSVADILRDYRVPVVPLVTEDLSHVTKSFQRVNSGGKRMTEVQMLNALTYSSDFELAERIDTCMETLREVGWEQFRTQSFLDVCKLLLKRDVFGDDVESLAEEIKAKPAVLEQASDSIRHVAILLRELAGIYGTETLPYVYQAVLLAAELAPGTEPTVQQKEVISGWLWTTTFTEYFRGINSVLFDRARAHLRDLLAGKTTPKPPDAISEIDELQTFHFSGARSKALSLLLAQRHPQDPEGVKLEPGEMLAEFGSEAMHKLLQNRELPEDYRKLADGPANRFLLHPRRAPSFRQRLLELCANQTFADSHVISPEALAAFRGRNWVSFLRIRQESLAKTEAQHVAQLGLTYRLH